MSHADNIKHLRKLLTYHQTQFIEQSSELISTLAGEDLSTKRQVASKIVSTLQRIRELVPKPQVPECVAQLESILLQVNTNTVKPSGAINQIIKLLPEISSHKWLEPPSPEHGFDFESIFTDCRERSKIPELFNSIIDLLEQIRDSDELDSRSMIDALSKLIATLQIGKQSTCFSLDGAWDFLLGFVHNYFWAEAKKIPGIGSLAEALEKTIAEARVEMTRLQDEVRTEMSRKVTAEVKALSNYGPKLFATYGRSGHLISSEANTTQSHEA